VSGQVVRNKSVFNFFLTCQRYPIRSLTMEHDELDRSDVISSVRSKHFFHRWLWGY